MPIFEFKCGKCGKEFEELVLSRDEKIACPKCSSKKVGKRMSTFRKRGGSLKSGGEYRDSSGGGSSSACSSCSGGSCSTCH
jgi:putative FmdB family regulatory protein